MNLSVYFNYADSLTVCHNLKCSELEVNKIIKNSLLQNTTSRFFRDLFAEPIEKNIEFDLDAWLKSTPLGEIVNRKSKAESRPVFTADPNKVQ